MSSVVVLICHLTNERQRGLWWLFGNLLEKKKTCDFFTEPVFTVVSTSYLNFVDAASDPNDGGREVGTPATKGGDLLAG